MISLINRLKKKKGFTIVELIVVMAIMGVILAMVLPMIFTSDKPQKGNALAKDFFYKAQDAMAISKIAYPHGLDVGTTPTAKTFYAVLDEKASVTETGVYSSGFTAFNNTAYDKDSADDAAKTSKRFHDCCENYFVDTNGMEGLIFVKVNEKFAVQSCYWVGVTKAQFGSLSDLITDDNNVLDGYYCGAYPGYLVDKGKTLLS